MMFRIVIQPSADDAARLLALDKAEFAALVADAAAAAKQVLGMPADADAGPTGWTIDVGRRGSTGGTAH